MTYMNKKMKDKVCIIGAGLAGLVTAKVLKNDGFEVAIFDKEPTIGGVWAPSRTYVGLCTNNPHEHYSFSDFGYPESCDEFPTAEQVFNYLKDYSRHFELESKLNLSTEVVSVSHCITDTMEPHSGFDVEIRSVSAPSDTESLKFDYVVMCNGVFSKPHIPNITGQGQFDGSILHSSQMVDKKILSGKRIVVVGAGKSALDCAAVAAHEADSCTLIFRKAHWMFPRYFPGGKRVDEVFFTRFSEKILPAYYRVSRKEQVMRTLLAPILWLWRRVMSKIVVRKCNIPKEMVPNKPVTTAAENLGIGTQFYQLFEEGLVQAICSEIQSFSSGNTLNLKTGDQIDADLVIFATGWKQDISILDQTLRKKICPNGTFNLYRHILPTTELKLAFNGYASAGNQAFISEVAAHWISESFRGKLDLPDTSTMGKNINKRHKWASKVLPGRNEGYFVGGYIFAYVDELLKDMNLPARRAGSFYKEYFEPIDVKRYKGLEKERVQLNKSQKVVIAGNESSILRKGK